MICIKADIPPEISAMDDELKAIYHSQDSFCIFVFKSPGDRNRFMDDTTGMLKSERESFYASFYELNEKQLSIF